MKMIFKYLALILLFCLCVWLTKVMFEAVVGSDLPAWMKYMILK